MAKVREAINILQSALPELGAGTEPYKAVLSTLQSLNKFIPPSAEVPGIQKTAVNDLARQAQQSAMMRQVMASLGGNQSPPPPPPLTPDSSQFNPDSPTGRFPTRSPRPNG